MAEKDATTRLRRAVKENNLFLVKRLIKKTDMRNPDPTHKRYTSLTWAAVLGHEETFEFLLTSGHDDREYSKDTENNTILILLADTKAPLTSPYGSSDHEFYSTILRMAKLYYDRYPDILDWANVDGKTALHVAALKGNEELVRMLCDLGADFDLADNDGNTPLHYASAWGHVPIVQLLIERGCNYTVRNNDGFDASDYAYSISIRDVLQDTARAQYEINKRARRNVFAQAAARGHEWGTMASHLPPPPPRMYNSTSGGSRMRSGSGTSRTTTTSDSGDFFDVGPHHTRSHPTLNASFSPSRQLSNLPSGGFSPAQPSGSSTSSFPTLSSAGVTSLAPSLSSNPASVLSPIATRMRERDADAMEKYKLRQRSGSGATTSTSDAPTQNGPTTSSSAAEDDLSALHSLVTVGSVAPRRRLRPSASATQLRSNGQPELFSNLPQAQHDAARNRSGTSPAMLKQQSSPATHGHSSSYSEAIQPVTPTQGNLRPPVIRTGSSRDADPAKDKYTGPPSEYAKFPPPPPPPKDPPERAVASGNTTPTTTHTRRLPFNILSHKHGDHHGANSSHKRNMSISSIGAKAS
ncbi:unnamed protein product [Somion occarium]|uniref:Ankyrin n=1 Tax=Somion occarium TaxID=3059160 RepID=A0ABP1CYZ2_9APHY